VERQLFDTDAKRYEAWYASPKGQLVDRAERRLLHWLLNKIPDARSLLEVGCGTGHFTAALAEQGFFVVGLDRAPAMIAEFRRLRPGLPVVLGDAHRLPFQDGTFDVTVFVSTLEFLEEPDAALAEAVRVSRKGIVLIVLNTWSPGGFSRRWGKQARGQILGQAQDYTVPQLLRLVRQAASDRKQEHWWRTALYPIGPAKLLGHIPIGDVIGLVVRLRPQSADAAGDQPTLTQRNAGARRARRG
jgi:ubiquinone/menaquinone biosynthesis C-methylase UbiE